MVCFLFRVFCSQSPKLPPPAKPAADVKGLLGDITKGTKLKHTERASSTRRRRLSACETIGRAGVHPLRLDIPCSGSYFLRLARWLVFTWKLAEAVPFVIRTRLRMTQVDQRYQATKSRLRHRLRHRLPSLDSIPLQPPRLSLVAERSLSLAPLLHLAGACRAACAWLCLREGECPRLRECTKGSWSAASRESSFFAPTLRVWEHIR